MAGNRQQSRFLALVSSYERLKETAEIAANSQNAAQLQYLKTLDSIEAKQQQLQTSMQSLYTSTGIQNFYKTLIDLGNSVVQSFTDIPTILNLPIPALLKFGTTFYNIATLVTQMYSMLRARINVQTKAYEGAITANLELEAAKRRQITQEEYDEKVQAAQAAADKVKQIERGVTDSLNEQATLRQKIQGFFTNKKNIGMVASAVGMAATLGATTMPTDTAGQRAGKSVLTGLGGLAQGVGTGLMMGGPAGAIMGVLTALPAAIEAVGIAIETTEEKIERYDKAIQDANNKKLISENELKTLTDYRKKFEELEEHQNDSNQAKQEFLALNAEIAANYPELISGIDEEGNLIVDLGDKYKYLAQQKQAAYAKDIIQSGKQQLQATTDYDWIFKQLNINGKTANASLGIESSQIVNNLNLSLSQIGAFASAEFAKTLGYTAENYQGLAEHIQNLFNQYEESIKDNEQALASYQINQKPEKNYTEWTFSETLNYLNKLQFVLGDAVQALYKAFSAEGISTNVTEYVNSITEYKENFVEGIITSSIAQLRQSYDAIFDQDDKVTGLAGIYMNKNLQNSFKNYRTNNSDSIDKQWQDWSSKQFATTYQSAYQIITDEGQSKLFQQLQKYYDDLDNITTKEIDQLTFNWGTQNENGVYYNKAFETFINQYNAIKNDIDKQFKEVTTDLFGTYQNFTIGFKKRVLALSQTADLDYFLNSYQNNDESEVSEALSILEQNSLDTIAGLETALAQYVKNKGLEVGSDQYKADPFIRAIQEMQANLKINFNTEYETLTESYTKSLKEFDKAIKNATSGMDFEDAVKLAGQLNKSLADFTFKDGKFFFNDIEAIKQQFMGNDGLKAALQKQVEAAEVIFQNGQILQKYTQEYTQDAWKQVDDDVEKYYSSVQVFIKNNQYTHDQAGWKKYIADLQKNLNELDQASSYVARSAYITSGDIDKFIKSFKDSQGNLEYQYIDSDELRAQLFEGTISPDFEKYKQQLFEYYRKGAQSVYDTAVKMLSGEESIASIVVTDANKQLLATLKSYETVPSSWTTDGSTIIDVTYEEVIENFNAIMSNALTQQGIGWKARIDNAAKIWNSRFDNNSYDSISSAIKSFQEMDFTTWATLPSDLRALADLNAVTGKFILNINEAAKVLNTDYLKNLGWDNKQINELQAAIRKSQRENDIKTIASELVKNRESLTEENISSIATALGQTYDDVIATLQLQCNQDGTYRMDMNSILQLMNQKQGQLDTVLAQMIAEEIDNIIGNVSSIASNQSKGVTSYAEMQKAASRAQQAGFDVDISNLYEWNDTIHGFVLSAEGILVEVARARMEFESLSAENKEARQLLQEQIESMGRQLANSIDINAFMQAENKNPGLEAAKTLTKGIDDYNSYLRAIGQTTLLNATAISNNLRAGGIDAVNTIKEIAKLQEREVTNDEISNAYRQSAERLLAASQELTAGVGEIVSDEAAFLINLSKGETQKLANGANLVTRTARDLYIAFNQLYGELEASGAATLEELNNIAAEYYNERQGAKKGQLLDMLSNSAEMTYNQLAEMFTAAGWKFTTDTIDQLGNNISKLNNGRVRINNFKGFAEALQIDTSSPEYLDAFKAYNDAFIEQNTKAKDNIAKEIQSLADAKPGDLINVAALSEQLGPIFDIIFSNQGEIIADGIFQITSKTNIPELIKRVSNASVEAGKILDSDVQKLTDSVDNLFKTMGDAISKGIAGTLTNSEKSNLSTQIKTLTDFKGELKFTQTYEGLKLSTDQAIQLYNQIKKVDDIAAHTVFESLTKQLTKSGEACESMSRAMAQINRLEKQGTTQARERAAIYREIANTQIQNPESYDWMNRDLPDYLKGPENYWNSLGTAFKALNEAAKEAEEGSTKAAHMLDPTDFYNMVNEFNNIAQLSGTKINFLGHQINGDMTVAAKLIQQGMRTLSNVDGDGVKVDLTKFGANFTGGAEGMAKGVHEGIRAMAKSQIEMLDGMIQLLETVVAMQQLGDITNGDGQIDLNDLFPDITGEDGYKLKAGKITEWANSLLGADKESDLGKALDSVKFGTKTLRELLAGATSDVGLAKDDAIALQKAMDALWQMYQSGDYSLQNLIGSIQQVLAGSGYEGQVDIGTTSFYVKGDYILQKGKDGWEVPGVGSFEDENQALKAYMLKEKTGATNISFTEEGQAFSTIDIGGQKIKVSTSIDGVNYDVHGTPCKTYNQAVKELYDQYVRIQQEDHGPNAQILTYDEWRMQNNVRLESSVNITNEDQVKQKVASATHEQVAALSQALASGNAGKIAQAVVPFGIEYKPVDEDASALQSDIDRIANLANIDTKTLALSLATEVVGDNADNVKKILANQPLSATVDLTGNLTNLDGTQNTLTYNEQVSVTLANIKAMATAESINWDGIITLINTVPEDKRPTVEAQAKQYIIKALEGNPEYQGFPTLLTGLQGLPIPALQATATVMSILWGGDKATNATGLTEAKVNALAAELPDMPTAMLKVLATLVQITDGGVVPEESAELATKLTQLFPDGKYTPNDIKAITLAATAAAVMINGEGVTATGKFDDSYQTTNGIAQVTADIIKLIVSTNASTTTEEGTTFNADNWQGTVDKIYAVAALLEVGLQNEADINVDGMNIPSNVATTKTIEALRASASVLSVIFQEDPTGKNINVEEVDRVIAELVDQGKIQASDIESIKAIVSKLLLNTADGNPLSIDNLNDILPLDKDNVIDLGTFKSKITIQSPEIQSDFFDYGFETEEELTADIKALSQRYQQLYNDYKSNFNDRTEAENQAMRENLNKIWSDRNAKILRKNSLNTPIEDAESAPIPINPAYQSKIAELSNIAIALHDNLKEVSGQDDYELEQMIENLNTSVRNYNNDALRNETTESALQKAIEDLQTYISQQYPNAQIPSVTETNNIPEEQQLANLNSQIFKWLEENNLSQEFTTWINEQELEVPDNILDDFKQTIQEFSKWLAQQDTTTQESFNNENINLNYDDSSITNLQQNLEKLSSSAEITETTVDTLTEALSEIPTEASQQVETFANAATTAGEKGASSANDISTGARNASIAVGRFVGNLSRIPNNKTVAIDLEITAKENKNTAAVVKGTIDGKAFTTNTPLRIGVASATGNAAAQGKTLVGQLGPELVVSNGRYYLVGQAGAQMVSLPDDAIVFNHLQTQNLLKKERGGGRGKPVTNERNAVAFAKGTGPAMASASAALAALKQIRAMWQSMLGATMKDLGSLAGQEAGKASSRSGGGSGDTNDPEQVKAVVAQIERWYNLLRQINRLQKEITYEENLQAEIESDRLANGKARYNSYKREIEFLDEEIVRNQQLADLQKSWYERKRQDLVNSDYGKIFTYDENGQLQYRQGANRGLDVLETLTRRDIYGQTTGASTNAQTQINYLRSIGFNTQNLKYNDDGTVLSSSDYEDNPEQIYVDMMQNFWDNLDGWKDELDGIYDSYQDQLNNVLTNQTKRNQLLQKIIDNQLSVEQDVLKAIESREQKLIDELQDERDAFEQYNKDFIDGLTDQLNQQKQMYQNAESEKELVKLRRQVAILQRSGGSASQIRSLQEQIAAKEQDQYFTAQEQQIAAIQKASDLQIDRMDSQIDLMTKTLEYQKQHGLLWEEVYQVMAATPQQIRQFIMDNTPDFQSASALDVAEKIRDIDLRINEWIGYRDDETAPSMTGDRYYDWDSYSAARTEVYGNRASDQLKNQAKEEFDRILQETGDINAAGAAADAIFRAVLGDRPGLGDIKDDIIESIATSVSEKVNNDVNDISKSDNYPSKNYDYGSNYNYNRNNNKTATNKNTSTTDSKKTSWTFDAAQGESVEDQQNILKLMHTYQNIINNPNLYSQATINSAKNAYNNNYDKLNSIHKKLANKKYYSSGGLVDYTGLAQVDGTPQRPEAFINAEQTQMLRNYLFGGSDSLLSLAQQIVQQMHGTSSSLNTNNITEQSGLNIEKIDVNVNVDRIANDYDVRQIGGKVMDEILAIARKSGTRGLSRR